MPRASQRGRGHQDRAGGTAEWLWERVNASKPGLGNIRDHVCLNSTHSYIQSKASMIITSDLALQGQTLHPHYPGSSFSAPPHTTGNGDTGSVEESAGGHRARSGRWQSQAPLLLPRPAGLFNSQVNGLPMRQPSLGGGWLVQKEGSKVK